MSKKLFANVVLPLLAALTGDTTAPTLMKVEVTSDDETVEFFEEPADWTTSTDSVFVDVETAKLWVSFTYQISSGRILTVSEIAYTPPDEE